MNKFEGCGRPKPPPLIQSAQVYHLCYHKATLYHFSARFLEAPWRCVRMHIKTVGVLSPGEMGHNIALTLVRHGFTCVSRAGASIPAT